MERYQKYISRCIEISRNGLGNVLSNPMVGCVIVHNQTEEILGEGFHQLYGTAHAEVNAINNVKDKTLLINSTLFVNLEPCNHSGKTPPCTDLILQYKIPKIVIGTLDPNPIVSGSGVAKLQQSGCEVIVGVLQQECKFHNRRFFTFHELKRPYIVLKWAQTIDGFIDIKREKNKLQNKVWISNQESNIIVHKWRSEEMGIMVGTNTAINDNPSLNVRYYSGNNPIRIVIDENLKLNQHLKIFDQLQKSIIFNGQKNEVNHNIEYIEVDFTNNVIFPILEELYKRQIVSILVEGGKILHESFIQSDCWDEARIIISEKRFFNGLKAPIITENPLSKENINGDQLYIHYNKRILSN